MSEARLENGYTRIANELLEAVLAHPLTKVEIKILLVVIRKTYGFSKSYDSVSAVQIESMTGIDRSNIKKTIKSLLLKNILIKKGKGRLAHGKHVKSIGINKRYKMWLTGVKTTPDSRGQNNPSTGVKTTPLTGVKTTPTKEKKEKRKGGSTKKQLNNNIYDEDEYTAYRRIGVELGINPHGKESATQYVERVKNAIH